MRSQTRLIEKYPWWWADQLARAWTVLGAVILLVYTLGGNGVTCSTETELDNPFFGTQVVMFNQVCENNGPLFALMLSVAFSARWWRNLLGWEGSQEARVILKKERGKQNRSWQVRKQYLNTLLQSTMLYLLEVVFIISQNLWVFILVVAGQQISTAYYLIRSPSDKERDSAHENHEPEGQRTNPFHRAAPVIF